MPRHYRRNCNQCGQEYYGQGALFCSISCRTTWRNLHENPAQSDNARAKIAAARMGKPTTSGRVIPQSQRDNIAATLSGRTLTAEHRAAIGDAARRVGSVPPRNPHLVGPAHPNWKGGFTPFRRVDFHTPRYRAFRRAVLDRDDWTCQDCGVRPDGRVVAHHIKAWGPFPEGRYDPANGVTLCHPCHHSRHRGVPRPVTVGPRTLAERESGRDGA